MNKQTSVYLTKPVRNSVYFNGRYISLSSIARAAGISHSGLSRALRGDNGFLLSTARKVAAVMGITLDELAAGMDARQLTIQNREKRALSAYDARLRKNKQEDMERMADNKLPIPRLPIEKSV